MSNYLDIVFDGPPGPVAGRFVEVEDANGKGVSIEWVDRGNGLWALRVPVLRSNDAKPCVYTGSCDQYRTSAPPCTFEIPSGPDAGLKCEHPEGHPSRHGQRRFDAKPTGEEDLPDPDAPCGLCGHTLNGPWGGKINAHGLCSARDHWADRERYARRRLRTAHPHGECCLGGRCDGPDCPCSCHPARRSKATPEPGSVEEKLIASWNHDPDTFQGILAADALALYRAERAALRSERDALRESRRQLADEYEASLRGRPEATPKPEPEPSRCMWSSRIGYDCELPEGHNGNHVATDLDGKSKVGWNSSHRSAYRRERASR